MTDDEVFAKIKSMIDGYVNKGYWAAIGVMETPPFTYTVGLHLKNLPELIITGIPSEISEGIINDCGDIMVSQGAYPHGTVIKDIANVPVTIIDAPRKDLHAIQAFNYYGHWNFPLQQIVFPDKDGKFPWEKGCKVIDIQPLLGTL